MTSKKTNFKPLLESADGIHLTSYLVNRGNLIDLKDQLRETISQSYEWLTPVMTFEERNKFLEPLDDLLKDSRIFKEMKGNIGIFRKEKFFRLVNIPVEVEQTCQVASSFHVKPILKWIQQDKEFLILGLEKNSAQLYLGSQSSLKLLDTILFPESMNENLDSAVNLNFKDLRRKKAVEDDTFKWINNWIDQLTKNLKPKLFITGDKYLVSKMIQVLDYKNEVKVPQIDFFSKSKINSICSKVRKIMKVETIEEFNKTLLQFKISEAENRVQKNIFQISKAVVHGRVRKLLVTDEINIFGRIDKKSGEITIHPFDLDHEDDDLLDDLAQMVLSQGGEVIVASKDQMPNGRPILAILDDEGVELEMPVLSFNFEIAQERVG